MINISRLHKTVLMKKKSNPGRGLQLGRGDPIKPHARGVHNRSNGVLPIIAEVREMSEKYSEYVSTLEQFNKDLKRENEILKQSLINAGNVADKLMDIRDQFAMAALTGIITRLNINNPEDCDPKNGADAAYKFADAMMEARKK